MPLYRMVTLAFAVLVLGMAATASARPKKQSVERTTTSTTTCDGTPIIMQGMPCRQLPARAAEQATEQTGEQPPKGAANGSDADWLEF